MADWLDPVRVEHFWYGLAGSTVYGVYTLATLAMAGQPVNRQVLIKAGVNVAAAAAVGTISAYFLAASLAALIPFINSDARLVSFILGVVSWEALPFALQALKARARREAERQGREP